MGSSNSRFGSTRPSTSSSSSTLARRFLSSVFCGASLSRSSLQTGNHLDDQLSASLRHSPTGCGESVNSTQQLYLISGMESRFSSCTSESRTFAGSSSNSDITEDVSPKPTFSNHAEHDIPVEAHVTATSLKFQPLAEPLSTDEQHRTPEDKATGNPHSLAENTGDASIDGNRDRDHSVSSRTLQSLPGLLLSIGEQGSIGIGVLLVDAVSLHSNTLSSSISEISNREARMVSRRMFWDALSRTSFGWFSDSPTIVFTTNHSDDLGSHDRWLLDYSGDLHYDGIGRESRYFGSGSDNRGSRRWQSRYEMLERFHEAFTLAVHVHVIPYLLLRSLVAWQAFPS